MKALIWRKEERGAMDSKKDVDSEGGSQTPSFYSPLPLPSAQRVRS